MSLKIWLDGKLVDKENAKISVYDHGLLYGDGVFEGIRVYSGRIFECEAHLDRLWASAKAIRLEIPVSRDEFRAAMEQTIKANAFTDCYIRACITRGVGYLGISPKNCGRPSVFIIADTITIATTIGTHTPTRTTASDTSRSMGGPTIRSSTTVDSPTAISSLRRAPSRRPGPRRR